VYFWEDQGERDQGSWHLEVLFSASRLRKNFYYSRPSGSIGTTVFMLIKSVIKGEVTLYTLRQCMSLVRGSRHWFILYMYVLLLIFMCEYLLMNLLRVCCIPWMQRWHNFTTIFGHHYRVFSYWLICCIWTLYLICIFTILVFILPVQWDNFL